MFGNRMYDHKCGINMFSVEHTVLYLRLCFIKRVLSLGNHRASPNSVSPA